MKHEHRPVAEAEDDQRRSSVPLWFETLAFRPDRAPVRESVWICGASSGRVVAPLSGRNLTGWSEARNVPNVCLVGFVRCWREWAVFAARWCGRVYLAM